MADKEGLLVVISGPSGVGKDSIACRLARRAGWTRIITATTRPRRQGEKDGENYEFLTKPEFRRKLDDGGFLEYAEVFGHLYGTPLDAVQSSLRQRKTALLLVDVQGARKIRAAGLPCVFIFVAPPDAQALRDRLCGRGREGEDEVSLRLAEADRELHASVEYDHIVVNEDLDRTVTEIEGLIRQRQASAGGAA